MAIVRERDFTPDVQPDRKIDIQTALVDEALRQKTAVKETPMMRLHGIKTRVCYYEQVVTDRVNNLSNTASLSTFDPVTTRFRQIDDFVILLDGELEPGVEKDIVTNIVHTGSAKVLPRTLVPTANDFFTMKVHGSLHLFKITEVNPFPVEKDSGYEINFELQQQDVDIHGMDISKKIKEKYVFSYKHVGTEFRTVFKEDEYKFIQDATEISRVMLESYVDGFYYKVFNTFMADLKDKELYICHNRSQNFESYEFESEALIGGTDKDTRSIYDNNLIHFMNKYKITAQAGNIHVLTELTNFDRKMYDNSIFSAMEVMDLNRFRWNGHRIVLENQNLYNNTNKLFGRFRVEPVELLCKNCQKCGKCNLRRDLFPIGFIRKLFTFNPQKFHQKPQNKLKIVTKNVQTHPSAHWGVTQANPNITIDTVEKAPVVAFDPQYESPLDVMTDIIALYLADVDTDFKRSTTVRLLNILTDYRSDLFVSDYEDIFDVFYVYPLVLYVLKYWTRELSKPEFV